MKLSTMLMIGGAAYLGYVWAKRQAAPAQTTQALQAPAPVPQVVVVEPEVDYGPAWTWGPSVFTGGFGGRRHHHHRRH